MNLLIWVVVGLAAGRLAQVVMKDDWHTQTLGNLAVGVLGAVAAGWIVQVALIGGGGFSIWPLVAALAGAVGLLWAGRSFTSAPVLR